MAAWSVPGTHPDSNVEHVTHVEHAGDVWRRDHDAVGFAVVGFGMKQPMFHPEVIPFLFNLMRVVLRGQFVHMSAFRILIESKCKFSKKLRDEGGYNFEFSILNFEFGFAHQDYGLCASGLRALPSFFRGLLLNSVRLPERLNFAPRGYFG